MPSNKQQLLEMECRRNIDQIIQKMLPSIGELSLNNIVLEATLKYPVGEKFVERFIHRYVENGTITIKDGVIYPVVKS